MAIDPRTGQPIPGMDAPGGGPGTDPMTQAAIGSMRGAMQGAMGGAPPAGSPADPTLPQMTLGLPEKAPDGNTVAREPPELTEQRRALVTKWNDKIIRAKAYWEPSFRRMREDMEFAWGKQWSSDAEDPRYTANVTLRVVAQKTAFLYAKNPRTVCRRREKILNTVWDGSQEQLQQGMTGVSMAMQSGMAADPGVQQALMQQQAIAEDVTAVREYDKQMDKIARTLELLYDYQVKEQTHPFKQMLKMTVRRTVTTGVGYVKIGFQRIMGRRPEIDAKIADISQKLATMERLSADMADNQFQDNAPEAEELRLLTEDLSKQVEFVVREGLTFDYPGSTSIIPDPKTMHLREFLAGDWVAQEYVLTPDEVQEIYGVDVGDSYTAYTKPTSPGSLAQRASNLMHARSQGRDIRDEAACIVWEAYNRKDGLVYEICDGYPEFLREPASPETKIERFYPWFALAFNECEHETEIFPPSDVRLMRAMQQEYNRARQGLREHRIAARPKSLVASGVLSPEDLKKLESHPANAILEINGLQPGQDVKQVLQAFMGPGLDPNLYEVNPVYEDVLRTTGVQEANIGGTSSGTATESNIAEASRQTAMGSNIDDLDDLLSQLAHAGGQILLQEVSEETVKKIVGPGAVWPTLSKEEIAEDLWLEVEAGSTGRPNQAQEIANYQRLAPLLMQIPGVDPEFLAKEGIKRMDDKIDMTEAFKPLMPSVQMLNQMVGGGGGAPTQPGAGPQPEGAGGPDGAANAQKPPGIGGSAPPDQVQTGPGGGGMGEPPMIQ